MSISWRGKTHKNSRISFHFFSRVCAGLDTVFHVAVWLYVGVYFTSGTSFVFFPHQNCTYFLFLLYEYSLLSFSLSAQTDCSLETNMVDVRPKTIYCHCQWWMLLAIAAVAVAVAVCSLRYGKRRMNMYYPLTHNFFISSVVHLTQPLDSIVFRKCFCLSREWAKQSKSKYIESTVRDVRVAYIDINTVFQFRHYMLSTLSLNQPMYGRMFNMKGKIHQHIHTVECHTFAFTAVYTLVLMCLAVYNQCNVHITPIHCNNLNLYTNWVLKLYLFVVVLFRIKFSWNSVFVLEYGIYFVYFLRFKVISIKFLLTRYCVHK